MLYQAAADVVAGMKAKLQIAGVPFDRAQNITKSQAREIAADQAKFDKLVRLLTPKP